MDRRAERFPRLRNSDSRSVPQAWGTQRGDQGLQGALLAAALAWPRGPSQAAAGDPLSRGAASLAPWWKPPALQEASAAVQLRL